MTAKRKLKTISTKEAAFILGKSLSQTRRDFNKLRAHFRKRKRQRVTVWEFCHFFSYDIDDVYELLGWDKLTTK